MLVKKASMIVAVLWMSTTLFFVLYSYDYNGEISQAYFVFMSHGVFPLSVLLGGAWIAGWTAVESKLNAFSTLTKIFLSLAILILYLIISYFTSRIIDGYWRLDELFILIVVSVVGMVLLGWGSLFTYQSTQIARKEYHHNHEGIGRIIYVSIVFLAVLINAIGLLVISDFGEREIGVLLMFVSFVSFISSSYYRYLNMGRIPWWFVFAVLPFPPAQFVIFLIGAIAPAGYFEKGES